MLLLGYNGRKGQLDEQTMRPECRLALLQIKLD